MARVEHDTLLDSLLYSVAHDLKSPLLTLALASELIVDAVDAPNDRAQLALDSLKHGAKDLERMLDAVTAVSRAWRRPLEVVAVPLMPVLSGHVVTSDHDDPADQDDPAGVVVAVDPHIVSELEARLLVGQPGALQLAVEGGAIRLDVPLADECPEVDGSPLEALLGSLHTYAGTPVEPLAALQVLLERQGGGLAIKERRASVLLPLATAP